MSYLTHITSDGDRWDLLAHRYYSNALAYEQIIAANPDVPIIPVLAGGIALAIPVVEFRSAIPDEALPPWKR